MGCGASCHVIPCTRPAAAVVVSGDGELGFAGEAPPSFDAAAVGMDESLGHSFCYVRSSIPTAATVLSRSHSLSSPAAAEPSYRSISGAAVSANSSVPPSSLPDSSASSSRRDLAGFRSSSSFSAIPLQLAGAGSDRGFFLSGPIERGALSGPLDPGISSFSGPISRQKRRGRIRIPSILRRSLSERNYPWVVPLRIFSASSASTRPDLAAGGNVQWADGKAGEDRVHVVVSEEHRWLFVGIYDGFNGPDAPEFLVSRLYCSLLEHLRGLFWEEAGDEEEQQQQPMPTRPLWEFLEKEEEERRELDFSSSGSFLLSLSKLRSGIRLPSLRWSALEVKGKDTDARSVRRRQRAGPVRDYRMVLQALSRALEDTETAYLEMTNKSMGCSPELALTGSCLLVVLMRDDDVYVMNLGDSRAIVAQSRPLALDSLEGDEARGGGEEEVAMAVHPGLPELVALQLSTDHSTSIEEEVFRIKEEHPDDDHCIVNGRVKGRLKVTRAFGAGFLKQPELNNALLEMFRNEYIGTTPYVSCCPSLCHHKLGPNDQFLVLSSDGLYQYLSNEEAVLHVELFLDRCPDGDPAQSLIEELLSRAAEKAGMDFYELLDIPQGDRRKYHDDVTVMVISLEGRVWRSSGRFS